MATAATPIPDVAESTELPQAKSRMLLYVSIGLGLALGGAFGVLVLGKGNGATEVAEKQVIDAGPQAPTATHTVENLVINPAHTNGQRFLLVTTTIVVRDVSAATEVAARDSEVRDKLVDFLGARTIAELSDATRREQLKADLAATIGSLFKEGTIRRVLLPQFVIQ